MKIVRKTVRLPEIPEGLAKLSVRRLHAVARLEDISVVDSAELQDCVLAILQLLARHRGRFAVEARRRGITVEQLAAAAIMHQVHCTIERAIGGPTGVGGRGDEGCVENLSC